MSTKPIKGKVVSNGETLPGANVYVSVQIQGIMSGGGYIPTSNGTATKADGTFELEVERTDKFITASYVGYQSQTIDLSKVTDPNNIEFNLIEGIVADEFVVIGKKPVNKLWIFFLLLAILLILGYFLTKLSK